MRPTHFFVPLNQSNLTKVEIERMTFDLCHYYFNWAGPIKVPAPCMYAHKIAELFTRIGYSKASQAMGNYDKAKTPEMIADSIQQQKPLREKLYFL